jgi:hypothetical protein
MIPAGNIVHLINLNAIKRVYITTNMKINTTDRMEDKRNKEASDNGYKRRKYEI